MRLRPTEKHLDKKKQNDTWTKRWNSWVKPTKLPGVWKRKDGGHLVRARVVDSATGKLKEIRRVMPGADELTALRWLEEERTRVRDGNVSAQRSSVRFADYAADVYERKKAPGGKIKSSAGRTRWKSTLEHLIAGTHGEKAGALVPGFGDIFIDKLNVNHVETWRTGMAVLIEAGDYAPTTANGWLSILRVVLKHAKRELALPSIATEGVENFDVSEHAVYTEEEPNALPAERVGDFLKRLRELYPQHYAMTYLGFVTGLRPSSLRPLRRSGPYADVLWDKNRILVRRSQTRGPEVMNTTKQKRRYAIDLPEEAMSVLKWHIDTQLTEDAQRESELLFPASTGGFRAPTVLNKPFAEVGDEMKLGFAFTQRGMRRTFNDLARRAQVESIVTRSISGHLTEQMQHHYSTVSSVEQRESIAKVIDLFGTARGAAQGDQAASGTQGGTQGTPGGTSNEKAGRGATSTG